MGSEFLGASAGHGDAPDAGISESNVAADGIDGLAVAGEVDDLPVVVGTFLVSDDALLARGPVHDGDVDDGRIFRLDGVGKHAAVTRKQRVIFRNVWRVGEVDRLAAIGRNSVEVVHFVPANVL